MLTPVKQSQASSQYVLRLRVEQPESGPAQAERFHRITSPPLVSPSHTAQPNTRNNLHRVVWRRPAKSSQMLKLILLAWLTPKNSLPKSKDESSFQMWLINRSKQIVERKKFPFILMDKKGSRNSDLPPHAGAYRSAGTLVLT